MRRRCFLAATVGLVALVLLGGCGRGKYTPKPNEELYGTWTNVTYSGQAQPGNYFPQKEVIDPAGYHTYRLIDEFAAYWIGPQQIVAKWTDSESNIWYKTHRGGWADEKGKTIVPHFLCKLSKSATVLEFVWAVRDTYTPGAFPTKIDPKYPSYRIYSRAK
jgi:hypothetical protein